MGSFCCSLINRDNSSQIYVNEGLAKADNEQISITHNNIPYKCIVPVSSMSQSKISYYSQLSASQYSNNQPMNMENSVTNFSYKQNTIDSQFGSIRPVDHQLFQFVDFPFLTSLAVIKWMHSSRIIFILRGPSGSGKSTIVECLKDKFPNAVICSSDHYFIQNDGTYKYDRSKYNEAENWCQNQTYQALESGKSPVIIDNPHIRCWQYKYNVDLSVKFDYLVMVVVPKTPWRFDLEQLHEKSTKSEPIWEIEKSINEFEPAIPLYFGWFLNDTDSDNILLFANDTLELMISITEIRLGLAAACDLPEFVSKADLIDHWRMKTERLHVTTKFCGYGTVSDAEAYLKSGAVQESLGQLFPIHVKGFLLTPRTFSSHIQLAGPKQIQLWAGDDQEDVSSAMNKYGSKPTSLSKKTGLAKLNGIKQARRPFGCRAHMTLMYTEGTKPVQSGLDQLEIIDLQLKNETGKFVAVVEAGNIIDWGQGRYYLELNYPIICQALFTGQY